MTIEMAWGGLHRIISGGQTGADQGGLLGAWRMGIETGGTAPTAYKTQDGPNPLLQVLGLKAAGDYASRTKANIADSDATVIIAHNLQSPGTVLTRNLCRSLNKPMLELDVKRITELSNGSPDEDTDAIVDELMRHALKLHEFIVKHQLQVLNVAGNREIRDRSVGGISVMTMIADRIISFTLELLARDQKLIYNRSTFRA